MPDAGFFLWFLCWRLVLTFCKSCHRLFEVVELGTERREVMGRWMVSMLWDGTSMSLSAFWTNSSRSVSSVVVAVRSCRTFPGNRCRNTSRINGWSLLVPSRTCSNRRRSWERLRSPNSSADNCCNRFVRLAAVRRISVFVFSAILNQTAILFWDTWWFYNITIPTAPNNNTDTNHNAAII